MVGPNYIALSCPTVTEWATTFTITLVLLELLNTFEEGGGGSPLKRVQIFAQFEEGGGPPLKNLQIFAQGGGPVGRSPLLVTKVDHYLIGH